MRLFLADLQVDHRNDKDDYEEDQRRRARLSVEIVGQRVVNERNHGIQLSVRHVRIPNTDDARVLLKASDKARDNDVGDHRGKKGYGDTGEYSPTRGAVDHCRFVILLVDALQAAEQYEYLERQCVPNDIDDQYRHFCPIGSRVFVNIIQPVDRFYPEFSQKVVDKAPGFYVVGLIENADYVKERCEYQADCDRVGYVGQEENSLEKLLQGLDRI